MGLFTGIFGGSNNDDKKEVSEVPWKFLDSVKQLEVISEASGSRPQVIFKHSTSCGISRMILNMFKKEYNLEEGQMDLYFLDLHAHREVSNAVAAKFGIMHQSPQLLILKNGVVVKHDSHGAISDIKLESYL